METQENQQFLSNSLTSNKPLSASQGSLRSLDNDSSATLSADEAPQSSEARDSFSPRVSGIPVSRVNMHPVPSSSVPSSVTPGHAATSPITSGVAGIPMTPQGYPVPGPTMEASAAGSRSGTPGSVGQPRPGSGHALQSPGSQIRPGSAQSVHSPATHGRSPGVTEAERLSRPPSHEVPIIKESSSPGGSQGKPMEQGQPKGMHHLYDLLNKGNRDQGSPHRPASAQSEPGLVPWISSGRRSLSPNVHAQQSTGVMNGSGKINKPACVRDLIHSAIERNLGQSTDPPKPDPRTMIERHIDKSELICSFLAFTNFML